MPTTSAPRRASHAETYAVPQPSSIARFPARSSGNSRRSDSGTFQIPQSGSACAQLRSAGATYCSAHSSQTARLRRTCSGRSVIPLGDATAGAVKRSRTPVCVALAPGMIDPRNADAIPEPA
jgi:hypothetical protein